ncbi:vWA domain-containing protein [Nonomuraea jiangxiensis]|uniref:Ca-activated chloride channel family protein n=1 Tax=Nonomuraea jiangxiensis TaxID=633440 RepID=A0A1G8JHG3_9ACTN|nr:VWA domain-containing protein [Nonomuraea jiangxiensis]SDI30457.1 Ca-activated chloride channel family protein [Nonomuraea jiangxiensis]
MATRAIAGKLAVIIALATGVSLPGVAVAGLTGPAGVAERGLRAPELAPVMLVLDASGSMTAAAPGGGDKMRAAKRAVGLLARQAPQGARLGLTVYGTGTGGSAAEKARGCQDVRVVEEIGADPQAIARAAQRVRPSGYTPIGRSLRVAAEALPEEGPRSIVLISDGEDTCAPPEPCDVAKELARQGVDLRVHTVGFDVDGKTKRQLTCVAQATGGTYSDAPDADDLGRALNRVTQRALRGYEPAGVPVEGGADPRTAAVLRPGSYLDQIDGGEAKYYAVDVPAGHTLYLTASYVFPPFHGSEVERVDLYAADGSRCVWRTDVKSDQNPAASVVLGLAVPTAEDRRDDPCRRPGRFVARVERDERLQADGSAALELLIGLEPPVADPGPPPTRTEIPFTEPAGPPRPVVGGGSFGGATTLEGSGTYTDTIQYGEFVFYRIWLDWGQGLAWRVRFSGDIDGGSNVGAHMYTQRRNRQAFLHGVYDGRPLKLPNDRDAVTTAPIRYQNRQSLGARTQSVAGWYYIAVQNGFYERDNGPLPAVTVTLEVSVAGEREPGPAYVGGVRPRVIFGGESSSPGAQQSGVPDSAPEPEPSAGASSREPERGPGPPAERPPGPWALVADAGPLVWAGVPLVVLLFGGGAVFMVLALRRRQRG